MTEIENERLRTRCAELAAEVERLQHVAEITNKELHRLQSEVEILTDSLSAERRANSSNSLERERLQSVIDEANEQQPIYQAQSVGGLWSDVTAENYAMHDTWRIVYARPIPAQQSPEPRGTNEYGLDVGYMAGKLNLFLRDIDRHTPDEAARVLARLAMVADQSVLHEPEFSERIRAGMWLELKAQQSPAVAVTDNFNGDDRKLIECATALLELDAKGALVPNGLGGHARTIIESFVSRGIKQSTRITEQDAREIIQSWCNWVDRDDSQVTDIGWQGWLSKIGRALLAKINDKHEIVGDL